MRTVDPGHCYSLEHLDGDGTTMLTFVKRIGERYPGNEGPAHEGVIVQEVLRALIHRVQYVDQQRPDERNRAVITLFRAALRSLEVRAAHERGDLVAVAQAANVGGRLPEEWETCRTCGHAFCHSTEHG